MRAPVPAGRDSFRLEEREVEFSSVEDLLKAVTDGFAREHEIARVIKTYLMDPIHGGSSVSTMKGVYSAIMSYFARNDRPVNVVFSAKDRYAAPGKDGYAVDLTLGRAGKHACRRLGAGEGRIHVQVPRAVLSRR